MAFQPLRPKTDFIRLPIPDYSAIQPPASDSVGIPVPGNPQPRQTYPRKQ